MPLLTVATASADLEPERAESAGATHTMRVELSPRLVMLVLGREAPSHADWRESVASIELSIACHVPILIVSHGASPTPLQSQLLGRWLARTRGAIVSDHAEVAAALDWAIGVPVFAMSDLDDALAHVGLPRELHRSTMRRAEQMYRDIVGSAPDAAAAGHDSAPPSSEPPSSVWRRRASALI